jgi:aspyridone synthetase trans-acting enoyl reductase
MEATNMQQSFSEEQSRNTLIVSSESRYELLTDTTTLVIRPDMMLCSVQAVALNPIDAKILQFSPTAGCVGGWDFAGKVVKTGSKVTRFKCGDRIFGLAFGLNPEDKSTGAFADYLLATEDLSCKIPSTLSFEKACTIGVSAATSGLAICELFGCSSPDELPKVPDYVLVAGGATSTGRVAIQLLK